MGITDVARKIPGVAAVQGVISGVLASEQDLPIKDYDKQTAARSRRSSRASASESCA